MNQVQISPFTEKVLKAIHKIPKGKVATYKQIAELAGKPHGSRGVAWILHSCSTYHKLPWHRVLSSKGKISFSPRSSNFAEQKRLLILEGVNVSADGNLNLTIFQWKKRAPKPRSPRGSPKMFS